MGSFKVIVIDGAKDSPLNWARSGIAGNGVTMRLINDRVRRGWRGEDAVRLPVEFSGSRARPVDLNLYPHDGEMLPARTIALMTGKSTTSVRSKGRRTGLVVKPNKDYANKLRSLSLKSELKSSAVEHYISNLIQSGISDEDIARRVKSFISLAL
tara:strand:+ start:3525 stop:3989 length:465 start_codon:yes stop_codon:yes gene_type:complete